MISSISILPALSLDGILTSSAVEDAFDAALFHKFIAHLLTKMNTFPQPNSVIVMDNCRIHGHQATLNLIEER